MSAPTLERPRPQAESPSSTAAAPSNPVSVPSVVLALLTWGVTVGAGLSWMAVFTDTAWLVPMLVVTAGVSGSSALARMLVRRLGFSDLWTVPAGLVALLLSLTWVSAAREHALFGLVPTPASLSQLGSLINEAITTVAKVQAPTASTAALIAGVCLLVGIVGLLSDFRAVTCAAPVMVGLLALILLLIPAALHRNGQTVWGFLVGSTCYLLLLVVSRYSARGQNQARVGTSASWLALGVGILVPVVLAAGVAHAIPQLSNGLVDLDPRPKNRVVTVSNPIVDLRQNLLQSKTEQLLTYSDEQGSGQYLRLMALDLFDGNQWNFTNPQVPEDQQIAQGMALAPTAAPVAAQTSTTTITVAGLDSKWLPLPYVATQSNVSPAWIYDPSTRNVFSKEESVGTTTVGTYTVQRTQLQPTPEQLRQAGAPDAAAQRFLALPANLPGSIAALAHQHADSQATNYDKAVALQKWLRSFDYDVRAPNNGTGQLALERFFTTKRGFCVHFASAMAVMARTLGIPSRVAVGYLPGTHQSGGQWSVTNRDAHAWPELYFQGVGWVPFEPTPANRAPLPSDSTNAVNGANTPEPAAATQRPNQPEQTPTNEPNNEQNNEQNNPGQNQPEQNAAGQSSMQPSPPAPQPPPPPLAASLQADTGPGWLLITVGVLAGLALLLGLLCIPRAVAWWLHRRRWAQAARSPARNAAAAASQLRADSSDFGLPWRGHESPRQFTQRCLRTMKATEKEKAAGVRLCQLVEQWQYAPTIKVKSSAAHDAALLRQGWLRQATRWQRLRATWLPPSLLGQLRHRQSLGA